MILSSIYLKSILPLMEDLVAYDQQAAGAIAGQRIIVQFEVKDGPVAHLVVREGTIRHATGTHRRPNVRLTFKTPELLNRMFAGEDVRPSVRKGFIHLAFLTERFPVLAERLSYYMEGEGQKADEPDAERFLVTLGLHAMLGGIAAVANDDASLAHVAAATPPGTLLVQVLPDGPHGTFTKLPRDGNFEFVATFDRPVNHANAVMEFASLDAARRLIDGELSAIAAIGGGKDMAIRGYLPLIEKANIFLGRFAKIMGR